MGLYENAYNIVQIYLLDSHGQIIDMNKIMIHTPKLKGKLETEVKVMGQAENKVNKFMLVTGGYGGSTYALMKTEMYVLYLEDHLILMEYMTLATGNFVCRKSMRRPNFEMHIQSLCMKWIIWAEYIKHFCIQTDTTIGLSGKKTVEIIL